MTEKYIPWARKMGHAWNGNQVTPVSSSKDELHTELSGKELAQEQPEQLTYREPEEV